MGNAPPLDPQTPLMLPVVRPRHENSRWHICYAAGGGLGGNVAALPKCGRWLPLEPVGGFVWCIMGRDATCGDAWYDGREVLDPWRLILYPKPLLYCCGLGNPL